MCGYKTNCTSILHWSVQYVNKDLNSHMKYLKMHKHRPKSEHRASFIIKCQKRDTFIQFWTWKSVLFILYSGRPERMLIAGVNGLFRPLKALGWIYPFHINAKLCNMIYGIYNICIIIYVIYKHVCGNQH